MEGQSFRAGVGINLNWTMGTDALSSFLHLLSLPSTGHHQVEGWEAASGLLNSPGPAPEAEDPSLGLTVCAIGLACIFIYFCCCCCSFFFFSRIRDFLIKKFFLLLLYV